MRNSFKPSIQLSRLREALSSSLAVIPATFVAGAVALAVGTLTLDEQLEVELIFRGGADAARSVLSTVAASMITFTGLVFSITIVALQLASSQFSPRVLRAFLRDGHTKLALGTFTATFTYAFVVLREVRSTFVPEVSVTVAIVLVVASLLVFVSYINHIAQSIRVSNILRDIARETRTTIEQETVPCDPDESGGGERQSPLPEGGVVQTVSAPVGGTLYALDVQLLVEAAQQAEAVLVLVPSVGDFVPAGTTVLQVYGTDERLDEVELRGMFALGSERSMLQDPAFGLRQIADIATRALSPGINDPTTAVQAIDHLHDLLRLLGRRHLSDGLVHDDDGRLRLITQQPQWEDFLSLAVDEIRHYGSDSVQVVRRLRAMLEDLLRVVPEGRRPALEREIDLLDSLVQRSFEDREDRLVAARGDEQGLGS